MDEGIERGVQAAEQALAAQQLVNKINRAAAAANLAKDSSLVHPIPASTDAPVQGLFFCMGFSEKIPLGCFFFCFCIIFSHGFFRPGRKIPLVLFVGFSFFLFG